MNGILLLIPFILIRFTLLSHFNKEAIKRAAHFAPIVGNETYAYGIYQISNVAIFIYLCFLNITIDSSAFFYISFIVYSYYRGFPYREDDACSKAFRKI